MQAIVFEKYIWTIMPRSGDSCKSFMVLRRFDGCTMTNGEYPLVLPVALVIVRKILTEFVYSTNEGTKVTISVPASISMIGTLVPETVHKYTPHTLSV